METASLPRAPRLPLLGSTAHYLRDPLGFLEEASRRGPLVQMDFVNIRAWLVQDLALLDQVLLKSAGNFQKDVFLRALKRVLGEGLLTAEGDFWKRQRRLIQPAFHREKIASYGQVMVDRTVELAATWKGRSSLDLHHEMMQLTSDIVTECLFGTRAGDVGEVSACLEVLMERYGDPVYLLLPVLDRLPLPVNERVRTASQRLDRVVRRFVEERRAQGEPAPGRDLLALLLNARDEDGSRMSDQQLRDEVLILFLAGHETTALALSWTFYELAKNPLAEAALHEELDRVLPDRDPTLEDLPSLPYTEHVVYESLRLHPPAWALGREALEPFELGGHHFDKGAWFWIVPYTLHRDPQHFPEPERFRPERFAQEDPERPRLAFAPFGAGPRACIGKAFAMMEAQLLLATLLARHRFEPAEERPVGVVPRVTLCPSRPVRMRALREPS